MKTNYTFSALGRLYLLMAAVFALSFTAQAQLPSGYCTDFGTFGSTGASAKFIKKITTTGTTPNADIAVYSSITTSSPRFVDKTSTKVQARRGDTFTLTLNANYTWWAIYYVFVDWNRNGGFDLPAHSGDGGMLPVSSVISPNECVIAGRTGPDGTIDYNNVAYPIVVPIDAALGETRIRLFNGYSIGAGGCNASKADGTQCIVDFILEITEVASTRQVTVQSADAGKGSVSLNGSTTELSKDVLGVATCVAIPAAGYSFANWTNDGVVVSTELTYFYTSSAAATLVANFITWVPAEYCVPTGSTTAEESAGRYLSSIKTTGGSTNLDFSSTESSAYVNVPETNLTTVMQGTSFGLQWKAPNTSNSLKYTHAELFIDWDGDGVFTGTCDSPTQEAYAKIGFDFNDKDVPSSFQSAGHLAMQDYSTNITVPAEVAAGKKRVRVKFTDAWHKNAHGACAAVDKGMIYDFTLLVVAATPYAVTYSQPASGGTFSVKNGDELVTSGTEVSSYTLLTIETLPATGYQVKQILINEVANMGNTFIMPTEAITVEVIFTDEIKLIHTSTGTGRLRIDDASGISLTTGSWLPTGSAVTLISTPNTGSELYTLLQNGTDIASSLVENRTTVTLTENTTFATIYGAISYPFTYSITPTDMGTLTIKKGVVPVASGDRFNHGDVLTATVDLTNPLAVVKSINLNGATLPNAISFSVEITQTSLLTVELEVPTYTLTYSITGGGNMKVTYVSEMDTPLTSGDVINKGEEIYLKYTPNTGESLVSSILNGTIDIVASDFYADGEAWIPIEGNMAIVTSFSSTGIGDTEADQAAIYVVDGVIYGSEDFIVYNFASQVVAAGKAGQGVSGLAAGTYIVRAGATVKKVIL